MGLFGLYQPLLKSLRQQKPEISDEEAHNFVMRSQLREMRRLLRRRHSGQKRVADRFARDCSRRRKKQILAGAGLPNGRYRGAKSIELLTTRYRPSPILDALIPGREKLWTNMVRRCLPAKGRERTLELREFDLLRNPEQTLSFMAELGRLDATELIAHVDFLDEKYLDAGAYLVLAEFWPQMSRFIAGGKMSEAVQKVLGGIGLDRELNLKFGSPKYFDDIWPFPVQRRRPKGKTVDPNAFLHPQDSDKVTRDFVQLVNEWLDVPNDPWKTENFGYELTLEGKANISDLIGELTCNAERYSDPEKPEDGDWSVTAFMVRRRDNVTGKYDLLCHMAFLSVGQSISQSLKSASNNVRKSIDSYVAQHRNCGLSEATLSTVVALQDTVTGSAEADLATRGGMGLQDVLKVVDELAAYKIDGTRAEVTIISGSSCIQLAAPDLYKSFDLKAKDPLEDLNGDLGERRLHWCNESNSGDFPPDRRIVKDLTHCLAGTLVTVAFALDNDYVDISGAEDGSDGTG